MLKDESNDTLNILKALEQVIKDTAADKSRSSSVMVGNSVVTVALNYGFPYILIRETDGKFITAQRYEKRSDTWANLFRTCVQYFTKDVK